MIEDNIENSIKKDWNTPAFYILDLKSTKGGPDTHHTEDTDASAVSVS